MVVEAGHHRPKKGYISKPRVALNNNRTTQFGWLDVDTPPYINHDMLTIQPSNNWSLLKPSTLYKPGTAGFRPDRFRQTGLGQTGSGVRSGRGRNPVWSDRKKRSIIRSSFWTVPLKGNSFFVTTSKALVTTSEALVTTCKMIQND